MTEPSAACVPPSPVRPWPGRAGISRWVTRVALLPVPLWFGFAVLRDPGPVWRAEYHGSPDLSGPEVVVGERRLSRYWDRQDPSVPGGFELSSFSVRFDTCLRLAEAREIPFVLVAAGSARFSIDEQERLGLEPAQERRTRGASFRLDAGTHHLRVEFSGRGWPSIGLNASLDGHAPVAVPPDESVRGVGWFHPQSGPKPCPER
ncbi:MAG: hypothetical protein ABI895_24410 [Deltaproteobacteria bacterium]